MHEQQCTRGGCDERAAMTCMHGAACARHLLSAPCDDLLCSREIGRVFVLLMRDIYGPSARLRDEVFPVRFYMLETGGDVFDLLLPVYREGYQEAGAPYGEDDAAMWRWWEEFFTATAH